MTKRSRKSTWTIIAVALVIFLLLLSGRLLARQMAPAGRGTVTPAASSSSRFSTLLARLTPFMFTPLPADYPTRVAETLTARPTRSPTATSTLAPATLVSPTAVPSLTARSGGQTAGTSGRDMALGSGRWRT